MNKEALKKTLNIIIRLAVFFMLDEVIGIGMKVMRSIAQGEHGRPDFVTTEFAIYGIIMKLLLVAAYMILGSRMPIKNRILKGLSFAAFFWAADYIPQVLGMCGAYSPVLNPEAVIPSTIIIDSIGYIATGILLGAIITTQNHQDKRDCPRKKFLSAIAASMIIFPVVLFVLEMIVGRINPACSCIGAFGISEEETVSFYIVFYLFQAVSGLVFPIFYRCTEYNAQHEKRWLVFANVHSLMLWTPIVAIMPFFGIPVAPTIVFAVIMLIALYIDTYVFCRVMD
ncbi:MAG: hypothetical protein Q4G60_15120 [bacterium]|nr:hypothetical protein [bacterium]